MKRKLYTDKEIIEAILLNNKEAISFLYEYNFESLNRLVLLQGGSIKDTEDIFHDAFLVFYMKIKKNDLVLTCSVHTFLQAIARNLWKQKMASDASRFVVARDSLMMDYDDSYDEEYAYVERRKLYQRHLSDMPSDCKRLIKLILEGLSLQEITRKIPYNSLEFTKVKRFRCKAMLFKKIIHDPLYNELKNERFRATGSIPRW